MMKNPFVSVIIPNYNHARYLDQRIQSVLGQTYQNFEVIILDDCSTDNSIEIIDRYRDNSHISQIIVNEVNGGSPFKQWNKGIRLAKGDLVWIAESDDYCSNNFLSELIPLWYDYPGCAMIQSKSVLVDDGGDKIPSDDLFSEMPVFLDGNTAIKNKFICGCFYVPNASAVLFRKDLAEKIANDYSNFKASGDRFFWICMLEKGDLCTLDKPLNFFRQHGDNVSSIKELDGIQNREDYLINRYLHQKGFVSGRYKYAELVFYWNYLHAGHFASSTIQNELMDLWFPGIMKNEIVFRIRRKLFSFMK